MNTEIEKWHGLASAPIPRLWVPACAGTTLQTSTQRQRIQRLQLLDPHQIIEQRRLELGRSPLRELVELAAQLRGRHRRLGAAEEAFARLLEVAAIAQAHAHVAAPALELRIARYAHAPRKIAHARVCDRAFGEHAGVERVVIGGER